MKEIRIHGRGGQGAVLAAELLVVAAFTDGTYGQAFPAFGGERRGAPVQAFVRLDERPVRVRYRVERPDYVIVLDRTLVQMVDVLAGLRPGGLVVLNSDAPSPDLPWPGEAIVHHVPATRIGSEVFGQPFVNPAMLGAFAATTADVSVQSLQAAFRERFPGSLGEKNSRAVGMGYEWVASGRSGPVRVQHSLAAAGGVAAALPGGELGAPGRPLHFGLVVEPRSALAYPTGGWRYTWPRVNEDVCNGCGICVTFCPDSSIAVHSGKAVVDMQYCKGCGICAEECNRDAISMAVEET